MFTNSTKGCTILANVHAQLSFLIHHNTEKQPEETPLFYRQRRKWVEENTKDLGKRKGAGREL